MDVKDDVARINAAHTVEEIQAVVRKYSANATGGDSVLYSGRVGTVPANDLAVEYAKSIRASIINSTPRGQFLGDEKVERAIKASASRIFQSTGVNDALAGELVDDFLYGNAKAPANSPTSIQNCLWCEASRDFAQSRRGDVKVIAVNANPYRVCCQGELDG